MASDFTPEAVARHTFRTSRRGYDPAEVDEFLRRLANELASVDGERRVLAERLATIGDRDLHAEFQRVGRDVERILESARSTAEALRKQASQDVAAWREQSLAEAEEVRATARGDAEALRRDAWETADVLLRQSQQQATRLREESERYAAELREAVDREAAELRAKALDEATELRDETAAETRSLRRRVDAEVAELRLDANREVTELRETAERETTELRETVEAATALMRAEAVQETAELRSTADAEVTALRAAAAAEVAELRETAERETAELRAVTADEVAAERAAAEEEIAEKQAAAEREVLSHVGKAERESHRTINEARREADDLRRSSRLEAERLVSEAQIRHDEIIENARKAADAAQERARALEQRRTELLAELESVRSTIQRLEAEIDARREAMVDVLGVVGDGAEEGDADAEEPAEDKKGAGWPESDMVRIIPAARPEPELPTEPVDATAMADEVRRLRDGEAAQVQEQEVPVSEPAPQAADETPTEAPPRVAAPAPPPGQSPTPVIRIIPAPKAPAEEAPEEPAEESSKSTPDAHTPSEPKGSEVAAGPSSPSPDDAVEKAASTGGRDELGSLFALLRSGEEDAEPDGSVTAVANVEPSGPGEPLQPVSSSGADPLELRDQMLLPVTNRALRSIKRQLTEAQNIALEEMRIHEGGWEPDVGDLEARLHGDLTIVVHESFAAGYSAAEQAWGLAAGRPKPGPGDIQDHAPQFASDLAESLRTALAEGGDVEAGPRQAAATVSRVFRTWRTDEAERRVRTMAATAYHLGLQRAAGAEDRLFRWVVAGRPCPVCRSALDNGARHGGEAFTDGVLVPPAHESCHCTIVPLG